MVGAWPRRLVDPRRRTCGMSRPQSTNSSGPGPRATCMPTGWCSASRARPRSSIRWPMPWAPSGPSAIAAGAVTGTAAFDAFGATTAQTGATSRFGFTGEMSDPAGIYLRARTLDPATGLLPLDRSGPPRRPRRRRLQPVQLCRQQPDHLDRPDRADCVGRDRRPPSDRRGRGVLSGLPRVLHPGRPWHHRGHHGAHPGPTRHPPRGPLVDRPIVPDEQRNPPRPQRPPDQNPEPRPIPDSNTSRSRQVQTMTIGWDR